MPRTPDAVVLVDQVGEPVPPYVRLETEGQIDAVTGVSGSGPAYVFHLIETMAAAGEAQGLPAELAMQLAKATVAGAGALALESDENPKEIESEIENV